MQIHHCTLLSSDELSPVRKLFFFDDINLGCQKIFFQLNKDNNGILIVWGDTTYNGIQWEHSSPVLESSCVHAKTHCENPILANTVAYLVAYLLVTLNCVGCERLHQETSRFDYILFCYTFDHVKHWECMASLSLRMDYFSVLRLKNISGGLYENLA